MKAQLVELVGVILRRIEEQPGIPPSESRMRSWLVRQGYNKRDIDAAIKMVWERIISASPVTRRIPGAVRQLSNYEAQKLSREAREALARLDLYELMDPMEREMLLDRLGQFEGEVGMEDLDYLLSWILCSTRDVESQQTIFNVFEGSRTLH
ncbi:MAG TPA: DUF494 family protein [Candidatus Hydrogenedentes bacterium]|nr:DUF494 family protein [Candidatus Hydrogenedentota bacterium]